jgi:transposase
LTENNISIHFLPTYSPELNPNEKVFAQVKNWLRYHRNTKIPLWLDVTKAFSRIRREQLVNYYKGSNSLNNLEKLFND